MRLAILVEGRTEELVVKNFLAPYCKNFTHVDDPINTDGNGRFIRKFQDFVEPALEETDDTYVLALIDLHNVDKSYKFPAYVNNAANPTEEKYKNLQSYLKKKVKKSLRKRCCVFPVVKEIETWLLADEVALNSYFKRTDIKRPSAPESIENPADELKDYMKRYRKIAYIKTAHGKLLFEKADAERVYNDNCPHFVDMIDALLQLQGIKPEVSPPVQIPGHEIYNEMAKSEAKLRQEIDVIWEQAAQRGDFTDEEAKTIDALEAEIANIQPES